MSKKVQYHWDLDVYQMSVEAAMRIFEASKRFPNEEVYSLAEGEAAETQVWLEFAVKCEYLERKIGIELHKSYDKIIGKLVTMGNNPKPWILKTKTE